MTAANPEALAPAELFERNRAWAAVIARNVHRKVPESFLIDDLINEALIEMWKRTLTYNPANARGTPFQAYAYLAVRGACLMSVRRKNWKEAEHASLDDTGGPDVDGAKREPEPASLSLDPQQQALATEAEHNVLGPRAYRRRQWLRREIAKLSTVDAYLITRTYIDEADLDTLAQLAGVPRSTLSRRLAGIVKRLKKARKK